MACKGLFGALVDIMNWTDDSVYKLYGQFITKVDFRLQIGTLEIQTGLSGYYLPSFKKQFAPAIKSYTMYIYL